MAAAAELRLLEKSLGLKPGNKYSAQGERQVRRSGRKAAGRRGDPEPTRPSWDTRVDSTPHVRAGRAAWLGLDLQANVTIPSGSRKPVRGGVGRAVGSDPCRLSLAVPGPFIQRPPCEPSGEWGGYVPGGSPSGGWPGEQYRFLEAAWRREHGKRSYSFWRHTVGLSVHCAEN